MDAGEPALHTAVNDPMRRLLPCLLPLLIAATWPPPTPKGAGTLHQAALDRGVAWPPPKLRITIDKSERTLTLFSADIALKTYVAGLGGAPTGDKVRQGDQRTPNGDFTVVTRNSRSNFHLFLGISYPDARDAERGLAEGWISEAQAGAIRSADADNKLPPWNTRLGGAIGIHGGGGAADWTLGCVAIDNAEIEELWHVARHGTPVHIQE